MPSATPSDGTGHGVSFRDAARFWIKLGFINFGGPTGQIAVMHEELVERRRWISNARFLHALNFCMLLPGPEAQQLAIYIGWLLHRARGGLDRRDRVRPAGVLPDHGAVVDVRRPRRHESVAAIFSGLQAAVVGIVAAAVHPDRPAVLRIRPSLFWRCRARSSRSSCSTSRSP